MKKRICDELVTENDHKKVYHEPNVNYDHFYLLDPGTFLMLVAYYTKFNYVIKVVLCFDCRYSPKAGLGRKYDEISGCARCHQFTDLPSTVFPMLCHLGPHLYLDPVLMIKIIRICKAFMKEVCTYTIALCITI